MDPLAQRKPSAGAPAHPRNVYPSYLAAPEVRPLCAHMDRDRRTRVYVASPPAELPGRRHVYHIYAVRARDRNGLRRMLEAEGVQTGLHYPIPVHLQRAYADLGYRMGDFPESEAAARDVLSLPIHPDMSLNQADRVVAGIEQAAYAD